MSRDSSNQAGDLPSGDQIRTDIESYEGEEGQFAVWWLGQHSFVLKFGKTTIYIDPFLSAMPERQVPPLLKPEQVTNADAICGTHDHMDHIDREVWPALAEASPQAKFIVPGLVKEDLIETLKMDRDRFRGLDDGLSFEIGEVTISAIPAAHEFLDRDSKSGSYPYLGFVLEGDHSIAYHAGDTCVYEGLYHRLRQWPRYDLMLLPINGRDAERYRKNILGNMTYQEAADLAGSFRAGLVIPTHWDMFEFNPGDPQAFVEYMQVKYPDVPARIPEYGRRLVVQHKD